MSLSLSESESQSSDSVLSSVTVRFSQSVSH